MCAEHIDGVRRPSSRYCSHMSRREAGSDSVTTGKVAKKRDGQFMDSLTLKLLTESMASLPIDVYFIKS